MMILFHLNKFFFFFSFFFLPRSNGLMDLEWIQWRWRRLMRSSLLFESRCFTVAWFWPKSSNHPIAPIALSNFSLHFLVKNKSVNYCACPLSWGAGWGMQQWHSKKEKRKKKVDEKKFFSFFLCKLHNVIPLRYARRVAQQQKQQLLVAASAFAFADSELMTRHFPSWKDFLLFKTSASSSSAQLSRCDKN